MRIAILGGSFDPPHNGHLQVAKEIIKNLSYIDQVWLMPCFLHPFDKKLSSHKDRFNMTKLLEEEKILVSDFEIKKRKTSYTVDTLNSLSKKQSKDKFSWIISSSEIENFPKWKDWKKIIENYEVIVFPRNIDKDKIINLIKKTLGMKEIPKNIIIFNKNFESLKVSSTELREKIRKNLLTKNLIDNKVEKYIINNNLYKK